MHIDADGTGDSADPDNDGDGVPNLYEPFGPFNHITGNNFLVGTGGRDLIDGRGGHDIIKGKSDVAP